MDILPLFDTPVFVFEVAGVEDLNAELAHRFVAERQTTAGLVVSNRGGWHSTPDLALRDAPVYRALAGLLVDHFRTATDQLASARRPGPVPPFGVALTAWAMVMDDGDYTVLHDHPEATWSSAYYVDAGDASPEHPESGLLTLVDPRRASPAVMGLDLFPSTFRIRPSAGLLVIFPGYLQHYVHAYRGQRPRVCVAANASIRLT